MTKTLGDLKGLLPTKLERGNGHETRCKCTVCFHSYGYAQAHDEISAIPFLDVVKKAVESGLVKIEVCYCVDIRTCKVCSSNGFTITEGEVSGG